MNDTIAQRLTRSQEILLDIGATVMTSRAGESRMPHPDPNPACAAQDVHDQAREDVQTVRDVHQVQDLLLHPPRHGALQTTPPAPCTSCLPAFCPKLLDVGHQWSS